MALVLRESPELRRIGRTPETIDTATARRLFEGFQDIERRDFDTVEELDGYTKTAWAFDRALYRVYMLVDAAGRDPAFEERVVGELNGLLDLEGVRERLRGWVSSLKLTEEELVRLQQLGVRQTQLQPVIGKGISALEGVELAVGKSSSERRAVHSFGPATASLRPHDGRGAKVVSGYGSRQSGRTLASQATPEDSRRAELLAEVLRKARLAEKRYHKAWGGPASSARQLRVPVLVRNLNRLLQKEGLSEKVPLFEEAELLRHLDPSRGIVRIKVSYGRLPMSKRKLVG